MILDFNENVIQAKNLDCPPFPIDFRHATKTIPAFKDNKDPKTHYIEFKDVQQILQKTDAHISGVCKHLQLVPASTVNPSFATAPARVRFDSMRTTARLLVFGHCDHLYLIDQPLHSASLGPPTIGAQYHH